MVIFEGILFVGVQLAQSATSFIRLRLRMRLCLRRQDIFALCLER